MDANEKLGEGWIPAEGEWTFKNKEVAGKFDRHVREQLPWYDLATSSVAHVARHYIPRNGLVYDIGASTGNIGNSIRDVLEKRHCRFVAIEESEDMAALYQGPKDLVVQDALRFDYEQFDFAVCFLVLMFMPIRLRWLFVKKLESLIAPGGALVIVDKINTPPGYCGTVIRRMTMRWKVDTGTSHEDIVLKELSLAGYQRPIDPAILGPNALRWFQFGEFSGWIIERPETGPSASMAEQERARALAQAVTQKTQAAL